MEAGSATTTLFISWWSPVPACCHDTVISGRAESATTLTCIIDNQPAHDAYLRWGYTVMGEIKHAPESPICNAMYLPSSR